MSLHSEISEAQAKPVVTDGRDSMVLQYLDTKQAASLYYKPNGNSLDGILPHVEFKGDLSQSKCGPGTKCGVFAPTESTQGMIATPASGDQVSGKPESGKPPVKPPYELPHKLNDDGTRPVKPYMIFKDGLIQEADQVKGLGGKPAHLDGEKPGVDSKPGKYPKDADDKDNKFGDKKVDFKDSKDGGKKEEIKDGKIANLKDSGVKTEDLDALKKKLAELMPQKPEVHYTPEQLAAMRAKKEEMWREMQTSGAQIAPTKPVDGGPVVIKPQPHDAASDHHAANANLTHQTHNTGHHRR